MIAIIMIARWCVIFGSTLFKNINGIAETLTDIIVIIIYVGLIISGTRVTQSKNIIPKNNF